MTSPRPTILLAGATGYIGRVVANEAVRRGHRVTALVRDAAVEMPGCETLVTEVTNKAALNEALQGRRFDAVMSCIASRSGAPADTWRVDHDANQNLLQLCGDICAEHFVLLSAICVQKPKLAFQHAKLAFEAALIDSGVRHSIVRPTAYFRSLSGQVERVLAGKPFLLFGDGTLTACKPISEHDLAGFLLDCLDDTERHNAILPIGGPGPAITPRAQGELLFELAGFKPRFQSVPPGLLAAAAHVLGPIGLLFPPAAAKAEFARIGHYYATESMLLWNPERGCYDADATPETGAMTLREHYAQVLKTGLAGHEAGEHRMF